MTHDMNIQSHERPSKPIHLAGQDAMSAGDAAIECMKQYAQERPEVVTLWAFGIGFVLGWKLKPW